jgi:hypothetical protein
MTPKEKLHQVCIKNTACKMLVKLRREFEEKHEVKNGEAKKKFHLIFQDDHLSVVRLCGTRVAILNIFKNLSQKKHCLVRHVF